MRETHTPWWCKLHGRQWTEGLVHRSGSKAQECIDENRQSRRTSLLQRRNMHGFPSAARKHSCNTTAMLTAHFHCINSLLRPCFNTVWWEKGTAFCLPEYKGILSDLWRRSADNEGNFRKVKTQSCICCVWWQKKKLLHRTIPQIMQTNRLDKKMPYATFHFILRML